MTLIIPAHALPLIPPADHKFTLAQCDTEIEALQKVHCKALVDFWGCLKKWGPTPSPTWNETQRDLHQLIYAKSQIDCPEQDYVSSLWGEVIAKFDMDVRAKLQMRHFTALNLVAIITQDQAVTVVHRYEGPRLYNLTEDDLSADNEDEDETNWFFKSHLYEPHGLGGAPYQVPCLYFIGTIDKDTQEWTPRAPCFKEHYELINLAEAMESLVEHSRLDSWTKMALPAFPSGVETRLHELGMLRAWLREKSYTSTDEHSAVTAARAAFAAPIEQLRIQIKELEEKLRAQEKLQAHAGLQTKLNFHGFELGQQVTHTPSGKTGVLSVTDEYHPSIFVDVPGEVLEKWTNSDQFEREMRLGEWAPVPEAHEDDAMHGPCERP